MLPLLEQVLGLLDDQLWEVVGQHLSTGCCIFFPASIAPSSFFFPSFCVQVMCVRAYPLLSGLCDVLVGLEETADVQGLAFLLLKHEPAHEYASITDAAMRRTSS